MFFSAQLLGQFFQPLAEPAQAALGPLLGFLFPVDLAQACFDGLGCRFGLRLGKIPKSAPFMRYGSSYPAIHSSSGAE